MTIELDPGHAGDAGDRGGLDDPARRRPSRTSTPTRSSPRSTATRAPTCSCCSRAAAQGLGGRGKQLSAGLRRFEPLGRDLAKINGAAGQAAREHRAARSPSFKRALRGARAQRHPPRRLGRPRRARRSGASPTRRRRSARRCASSRRRWRRRSRASPAATSSRRCSAPAATQADPDGAGFVPAQRDAADRSCARPSAPIAQPDPAVHHAGPQAGQAPQAGRRAARRDREVDRARRSPTSTRLFNAWAYNPPGSEEGYLFWTAWLNHNTNALCAAPGRQRPAAARRRPAVVPDGAAGRGPRDRAPVHQDAPAVHERAPEHDHLPARPEHAAGHRPLRQARAMGAGWKLGRRQQSGS